MAGMKVVMKSLVVLRKRGVGWSCCPIDEEDKGDVVVVVVGLIQLLMMGGKGTPAGGIRYGWTTTLDKGWDRMETNARVMNGRNARRRSRSEDGLERPR